MMDMNVWNNYDFSNLLNLLT